MKIIVKLLTGKELDVDVENSDTTENLKLKIEKIEGKPGWKSPFRKYLL